AIKTFYKPKNNAVVEENINKFLTANQLNIHDIDLVITGRNGDTKNDSVYNALNASIFQASAIANYKHLCGDYPTVFSFGLWLAANIIKRGVVPDIIREKAGKAAQ